MSGHRSRLLCKHLFVIQANPLPKKIIVFINFAMWLICIASNGNIMFIFFSRFSPSTVEEKAKWVIWIIIFIAVVKTSAAEGSVDCINIYSQPAFDDVILQNHKIQERPSEIPKPIGIKKKSKWKTWEAHVSTWQCPAGTVPIRNNEATSSNSTVLSYPHEHAVATANTLPKMYGAKATMSVWNPTVETEDEFSLSQIWISSGSYKKNNLNSIEVGWHVSPGLYQDNKPRLFIYWTSDTYVTGCYNLQCAGFIQTSNNIVIGGAITPVSTSEGNQYEITVSVWKDQKSGNWWLSLGPNHSLVGYWPAEIFTNLSYADEVQLGGEILNSQNSGRHTAAQMGSGHFPNEGFGKVSYIRNLEIVNNNRFQPVQEVKVRATDPKFYKIRDMFRDDWGTYIFFGGPGMHSGVSSLAFSSFPFYFSLIIFLA